MRYLLQGQVRDLSGNVVPSVDIEVRLQATNALAEVFSTLEGEPADADSVITSDSQGNFLLYFDPDTYPLFTVFKLTLSKTGYTTVSFENMVAPGFGTLGLALAGSAPTSPSILPYTRGDFRRRLATFYSSDPDDAQVVDVLNECIQTGYEKVVSIANNHARQTEVTLSSLAGIREYNDNAIGIPTFVGYKSDRLIYLPYDNFREKYDNFHGTEWDQGDPVNYSLRGFNGLTKTVVIAPSPKEAGESINVLCFQSPGVLNSDDSFPLVPVEWAWLVLERAKIERLRFEEKFEAYQIQAQEFVAYMKIMITRLYPALPDKESGFVIPSGQMGYNIWRNRR
jgi:hypothetical protein